MSFRLVLDIESRRQADGYRVNTSCHGSLGILGSMRVGLTCKIHRVVLYYCIVRYIY